MKDKIKKTILSIDIGGTFIKFGIISDFEILVNGKIKIFPEINIFDLSIIFEFIMFLYVNSYFYILKKINKFNEIKNIFEIIDTFNLYINKINRYKRFFEKIFDNNDKDNKSFFDYISKIIEKTFLNKQSEFFINSKNLDLNNKKLKDNLKIQGIAISSPGFCNNIDKKIEGINPNLPNITNKSFKDFINLKINILNDLNAQGYYYLYLRDNNLGGYSLINEDSLIIKNNENNKKDKNNKIRDFYKQNKLKNNCEILIAIGSGIGGSIIIGNKIFEGKDGFAGEIGHIIIDKNSNILCGCGKKGCAEVLASARSLIKRFDNKYENGEDILKRFFNNELDSEDKNKVEDWLNSLSILTGNLINIFNPSRIIFSGALLVNYPQVLKIVHERLKNYAFINFLNNLDFVILEEGKIAGIMGAYIYFLNKEKIINYK